MTSSPLPGAPFLAYREGELFLEDVRLADLAREHGTPLFVYSKASMLAALNAYRRGLQGRVAHVHYAMKANSSLAVLQVFAQAGCGFDIVSGGELERVIAAGGDPSQVIFSGVGKTRAEMRTALLAGIECFNVESEGELEVLDASLAKDRGLVAQLPETNAAFDAERRTEALAQAEILRLGTELADLAFDAMAHEALATAWTASRTWSLVLRTCTASRSTSTPPSSRRASSRSTSPRRRRSSPRSARRCGRRR